MSKDKMIEVLHDIQIAESIFKQRVIDFDVIQSKNALIEGVLQKHGITQAELDSSLVWYSDNVEVYMRVNDSVIATLKRELDHVDELIIKKHNQNRVVNFSLLPEYYYLSEANPTLTFHIDSVFIKDFPNFQVKLETLWSQENMEADLCLSFTYDDTIWVEQRKLVKDDIYVIDKPERSNALKDISGYIHLNRYMKDSGQRMLLYNITLKGSKDIEEFDDSIQTDSLNIN